MLVGWLSQDGSSVLPPLSLFCQLSVSSRFSSFPLFFLHDLLLTLRLLLPASSPFPPVEKEQINKTNKRHFLCTRVVMFSCFHRLEIIRFSHVHLLSLKSLVICFWGRGGGGLFLFWTDSGCLRPCAWQAKTAVTRSWQQSNPACHAFPKTSLSSPYQGLLCQENINTARPPP